MCKNVADRNMDIFEDNMSTVVVLHVQSCNLNKSLQLNFERKLYERRSMIPVVFIDVTDTKNSW